MAALTATHPTLLDLAKRSDPDNKIATIVEILNQTNEILADMVWQEGNLPTGHRTTIRSGLPAPTWRKLYGGVQPTKSTTVQVTDNCANLEAYAEVDKDLADLNGNTPEFRLSEDRAHIEGMNQEMAETLFEGSEATAPEEFTGLNARFNSLSAANGDNIISEGDSSNLRSIWLIVWGPNTVHGIVPKGSTAGLRMEDKGQVTDDNIDGSGGRAEIYRTHYKWQCGLTVRDWRYLVRIANIDYTDIVLDAATGPNLIDLMTRAIELVPDLGAGRPAFYMDRTLRTGLRRQMQNALSSSTLTYDMLGGKPALMFSEVPVRRVDALANDETAVS